MSCGLRTKFMVEGVWSNEALTLHCTGQREFSSSTPPCQSNATHAVQYMDLSILLMSVHVGSST